MASGRTTTRQFQCNDTLWGTYRRMAADQEKDVDALINDALEAYAQLAGYQTSSASPLAPDPGMDDAPPTPPPQPSRRTSRPPRGDITGSGSHATGSHSHSHSASTTAPLSPPPPPAPTMSRFASRPMPAPAGGLFHQSGGAAMATSSPSYVSSSDGAQSVPAPPLYLVFDNQKYRIDKDQFIIGRGAKSSDLPIKDGNISRKHAAVIRRNGTYFIKDLGSTNGIDFKGMRIDNKRIDEGDLFHLCDYELRFTFKR
jgi:hypothetical protein